MTPQLRRRVVHTLAADALPRVRVGHPSEAPFNLNLRFYACRKVDRCWVGNRTDRRGLLVAAAVRYQLGAPLTFILIPVTLSTGPVMTKILSSRPAKVLLVAPPPVGIVRMLFPLGSKAITPSPLLI